MSNICVCGHSHVKDCGELMIDSGVEVNCSCEVFVDSHENCDCADLIHTLPSSPEGQMFEKLTKKQRSENFIIGDSLWTYDIVKCTECHREQSFDIDMTYRELCYFFEDCGWIWSHNSDMSPASSLCPNCASK